MEKIVVENISHNFLDNKILDNINFTLNKGEVISILGESGCGKTTILHICANLIKQTEGKIENSFKKSSFLFQDFRLLPWQNVIDNISLSLKDSNLTKEQMIKKSEDIALDLGLDKKDFYKYPKDLSGGMKSRVSLARALVTSPSLLFLDEPFSALDVGLKKDIYKLLLPKVEKKELSILFITHDLMEAIQISDKIIVLKKYENGTTISNNYSFEIKYENRDNNFIYNNMIKLSEEF